ncbi:MAG: sulfatase [Verrucomicrobiota bacterium]
MRLWIGLCFLVGNFDSICIAEESRPNVLFIAIDDLNDWIGCLGGHPQVETPHMDALASRGVLFTEAHCPAPVCGPCRAAVLSGLGPVTTGVYSNNANWNKRLSDRESLPAHLNAQGYRTMGAGKIFHGDHDGSFDLYAPAAPHPWPKEALQNSHQNPHFDWKVDEGKTIRFPRNGMPADRVWQNKHSFDWGPVDVPEEDFRDAKHTQWVIEQLGKSYDQPIFMAMGFHLPHQPLFAPKRFHDLYPVDEVELPPVLEKDLDDLSQIGRDYALIPTTSGTHATVVKYGQWEEAVSSYLATVSYVDDLLGQLIEALDSSPHANRTWIVLWSDHGWHLGEKQHWGKATGWFRATRVPLLIVPPREGALEGFSPGVRCERPVNLIDLFPTILEMTGLPAKEELEGNSLIPLLADPQAEWAEHTITTFGRGNHAISTPRWRFIRYFDGSEELYDRSRDPNEWNNLAKDPEHAEMLEKMRARVPTEERWRHFVRYGRFKAVIPSDGSPMLLFNHEEENHLEERYDESAAYPDIVKRIEECLRKMGSPPRMVTLEE